MRHFSWFLNTVHLHPEFEIFIFCPKNSTLISRENYRFFRVKTRENVVVFDFIAFDNSDFTRKIVKKNLGEKPVKMLGFFVKVEFLYKNLTFWIVRKYTTSNRWQIFCIFYWPRLSKNGSNNSIFPSILEFWTSGSRWLPSQKGRCSVLLHIQNQTSLSSGAI